MKKKISLIACVLAFVLMFTGCQSVKEEVSYNKDGMEQVAEFLISNFTQFTDEQFDAFLGSDEFSLNYTLMNAGLAMDADVFKASIDAWRGALDECGAYEEHGDFTLKEKSDGAVLKTKAHFADREAELEFSFNEKSRLESLTVSAEYTRGEILEKAGLNTVLGMGTVFIVLIFMAFIISLIKYIPGMLDKMSKKQTAEVIQPEEVLPAAAPEAVSEDLSDDEELVAVITAAIAASEGPTGNGFVVRSIKKRRTQNHW